MKPVLTTLFIFICLFTYGQDNTLEIIGEITNSETQEAIPYVHVFNLNTKQGTASNTEGRFWINMTPGDTLAFSAIGFQAYQFIINENITTDKLVVSIELSPSTLELEAVKVFAFRDEYALKRALIETEVPIETEETGLKIPGVKASRRPVEGGGIAMGGPLTAIGNLFSKEVKEKKKMAKITKEYDLYKSVSNKYNKKIVMDITGLPEDKVEDFMEFCKMDEGYLKKATEYEIAVVINRCLNDFDALEKDQ